MKKKLVLLGVFVMMVVSIFAGSSYLNSNVEIEAGRYYGCSTYSRYAYSSANRTLYYVYNCYGLMIGHKSCSSYGCVYTWY